MGFPQNKRSYTASAALLNDVPKVSTFLLVCIDFSYFFNIIDRNTVFQCFSPIQCMIHLLKEDKKL